MPNLHPVVAQTQNLFQSQRHDEALAMLDAALYREPKNKDLLIEKGRYFCYLQREDEAVDFLERGWGATGSDHLAQLLTDYCACRTSMAKRLGVADQKGAQLAQRVQKIAPEHSPKSGISLSAILIVKNEEKHLRRCLESLKGNVDQIVVVDTGSTDGTLAIAEEYDCTIGHFEWVNDFSAARNASLELANGCWALWIDADEEVDAKSWTAIREALTRPQFGGYFVKMVNFTDEDGNSQYTHAPVRLFRNLPEIRFEGKIHEQMTPSIDKLGLPLAHLQNVVLWHYGYMPSEMQAKNKVDRTISMLLDQIAVEPEDAFHWFNLANAYSVAGRHEDAIHASRECIKYLAPSNPFGSLTFQILQAALNSSNKPQEALDASFEAKRKASFTILNQFEVAHSLYLLRRYEDALQAIDTCMSMSWPDDMTGDKGIVTHKSHVMKGQILTELERAEEGLQLIEFALGVDPNFGLAKLAKGCALEALGRSEEALRVLESVFNDPQFAAFALKAAGRSTQSLGRIEEAIALFEQSWRMRPGDREAWSLWAQAAETIGDLETMLTAYSGYAEWHQPNSDVYVNWGRALAQTGKLEEALNKYEQALKDNPQDANAYFNCGDLLYSAGVYADAAACYEAGLRIEPENADGWFTLGNCAGQLGVWDAARAAYEQAIALDASHERAQHNLTVALQELSSAA